ncbi:hypothetical protein V6N13_047218 [Hibiscus sabdariffa]
MSSSARPTTILEHMSGSVSLLPHHNPCPKTSVGDDTCDNAYLPYVPDADTRARELTSLSFGNQVEESNRVDMRTHAVIPPFDVRTHRVFSGRPCRASLHRFSCVLSSVKLLSSTKREQVLVERRMSPTGSTLDHTIGFRIRKFSIASCVLRSPL